MKASELHGVWFQMRSNLVFFFRNKGTLELTFKRSVVQYSECSVYIA